MPTLMIRSRNRHLIPADHIVQKTAVLGGLHHEYSLEKQPESD
jgi:hypothetical protein